MFHGMETVLLKNYIDRNGFANVGVYSDTVSNMFYPYVKPQDTGNLTVYAG